MCPPPPPRGGGGGDTLYWKKIFLPVFDQIEQNESSEKLCEDVGVDVYVHFWCCKTFLF